MRAQAGKGLTWIKKQRYVGSVPLLLMLIFFAALALSQNDQPQQQPEPETVTYSTDTPSEQKPGPNYNWQGGPSDPKKISIPSVGIDGFIQKVGVDQNKQIAVPSNVHIAGWFIESVRPGEKGLSIIDAHLDGRINAEALFSNLPSVQKDAEVTIEFGDGSKKSFVVTEMHEASVDEANSILFSQTPTATNQLNLITCVGTYNKEARTYDKRFIVYTQLKQ